MSFWDTVSGIASRAGGVLSTLGGLGDAGDELPREEQRSSFEVERAQMQRVRVASAPRLGALESVLTSTTVRGRGCVVYQGPVPPLRQRRRGRYGVARPAVAVGGWCGWRMALASCTGVCVCVCVCACVCEFDFISTCA